MELKILKLYKLIIDKRQLKIKINYLRLIPINIYQELKLKEHLKNLLKVYKLFKMMSRNK